MFISFLPKIIYKITNTTVVRLKTIQQLFNHNKASTLVVLSSSFRITISRADGFI